MKIVFDTEKDTIKVGSKTFGIDMANEKQDEIISKLRGFVKNNSQMTEYETDSMWMSYRYCIGRHTIASHMRAGDIAEQCYGRMSPERSIFNAYDINREIEDRLRWSCGGPEWHFPVTSLNKIYTSAIDIFCQFVEDYNIKTKADYLKYYSIDVILADNERGYKIETTTWEEKLATVPTFEELYGIKTVEQIIEKIKELKKNSTDNLDARIRWIVLNYPNEEYFTLSNIEDLFVWNNLVHLFDIEHHHKSVLVDGSECVWYWSYTHDTEQREDGYFYRKEIGYKRIRVPVDARIGSVTTWIPDENIINDLY